MWMRCRKYFLYIYYLLLLLIKYYNYDITNDQQYSHIVQRSYFSQTGINLFFFQLNKLTVPVLKDFAREAGITTGTKKADIIAAINDHLGL